MPCLLLDWEVLIRYPDMMLTKLVDSNLKSETTADGAYILRDRNVDMFDIIYDYMRLGDGVYKLPRTFDARNFTRWITTESRVC